MGRPPFPWRELALQPENMPGMPSVGAKAGAGAKGLSTLVAEDPSEETFIEGDGFGVMACVVAGDNEIVVFAAE